MHVSLIASPTGSPVLQEADLGVLGEHSIESATEKWGFPSSEGCLIIPEATFYLVLVRVDEPGSRFFLGVSIDGRATFSSRKISTDSPSKSLATEAGLVEFQDRSDREFPLWEFWEEGGTMRTPFQAQRGEPFPDAFPEAGVVRVHLYSAREQEPTSFRGGYTDCTFSIPGKRIATTNLVPGDLLRSVVINYQVP